MTYGVFDLIVRITALICIIVFSILIAFTVLKGPFEGGSAASIVIHDLSRVCVIEGKVTPVRWKSIIIHHSGVSGESLEEIREHYSRMGFSRLPFHFLIFRNGKIQATRAWRRQERCEQTLDDYFNRTSIAVCVVGNFSKEENAPLPAQMRSLRKLVRFLMRCFKIQKLDVLPCREVDDTTESPGKYFPWMGFLRSLR